jgi:hypothetical protein
MSVRIFSLENKVTSKIDKSNSLLTDILPNHVDNHLDQDQEIHQDIIVVKMDKKFESPNLIQITNLFNSLINLPAQTEYS